MLFPLLAGALAFAAPPSNVTVCWKGDHARGVGKPIHTCIPPLEKSGALCYPACHTADPPYDPVGPVCWQQCKPGYVDEGALCRKDGDIKTYAKHSYGRGAGYPLTCSAAEDEQAALCYPKCPAEHPVGIGPVCWDDCATVHSGEFPEDGGALCCANSDVCSDKIRQLSWGIPEAVAKAILSGDDPATILNDVKAAVEAILGFVMPICSS